MNNKKEISVQDNEYLNLIFDEMIDGIIMLGYNGEIVINSSAKRILHLARADDIITQEVIKERLGFNPFSLIDEVKSKGEKFAKLEVNPFSNPNQAIVSQVNNSGSPIGVMVVLRDITEEKEIDQMKNEFISVISHELKTPLTTIKGAISSIIKKRFGEITEKQEKLLEIAERDTDRLTTLINDLLSISQIEAKKIEIHFKNVAINDLINNLIALYSPIAQERKITLEKNIQESLPIIYADPNKITQIIENLINNAFKFTSEGGKITINANLVDIEDNNKVKKFVCISVSDTGVGIPEKQQKRIFDKFTQVDSSYTRKFSGVGLGLAICKGIVEAHKGRIWLESKENEGSTFFFTLPVDKRQ